MFEYPKLRGLKGNAPVSEPPKSGAFSRRPKMAKTKPMPMPMPMPGKGKKKGC